MTLDWAIPLLLASLVAAGSITYLWRMRRRALWLLPTSYVVATGILQFSVRTFVLATSEDLNPYRIVPSEASLALAYYAGFLAIFLSTFHARRLESRDLTFSLDRNRSAGLLAVSFLATVYLGALAYRIFTGHVYTLYEDLSELYSTTEVNIGRLLTHVKWLIIPSAVVLWRATGRRVYGVIAGVVVSTAAADAFVTTSKGDLFSLAVLYVALSAYLRRRVSRLALAGIVATIVAFGLYSYMARQFGTVRGQFSWEALTDTVARVEANQDATTEVGVVGAVARFNYLDGLSLCVRNGPGGLNEFAVGSLLEVAQLVPRSLWPGRPHLSFNHYATRAIWGEREFLELPIGRVGESYHVLGVAGLLYAGLYGWLFSLLVRRVLRPARTVSAIALYFCLLVLVVVPDAHLAYNLKPLVYLSPLAAVAWTINRWECALVAKLKSDAAPT